MSIEVFTADSVGEGVRIGIVQARFNDDVCTSLLDSCLAELERLGVQDEDVFVCTVPGALEIPSALQSLARTEEFDALIALGAVIRGETYHFEVVSNESAAGVMRVSLDCSIPIANAILTTEDDDQAQARAGVKGAEAARVAVEMANLADSIASLAETPEDETG
jgi:6,7-dimethyl-8-ribityllumazine synthase